MKNYYFTSESVTEGHPDKLCDYISDLTLDEYLKQDSESRVAVETFASKNQITIAGQITSAGKVDIFLTDTECNFLNVAKKLLENENIDIKKL